MVGKVMRTRRIEVRGRVMQAPERFLVAAVLEKRMDFPNLVVHLVRMGWGWGVDGVGEDEGY